MSNRKNINTWLSSDSFDSEEYDSIHKEEREHFKSTCRTVNRGIQVCPVPVAVFWNNQKRMFHFRVGMYYCNVFYNKDIAPYDTFRLVYYWSRQFYPSYRIEIEQTRSLTSEEIVEGLVDQDITPDFLFSREVTENVEEYFRIEKYILQEDKIFNYMKRGNVVKHQIRLSTIPLSVFLKDMRSLTDEFEKKAFVDLNTKLLESFDSEKTTEIRYEGRTLTNFIDIRLPEYADVSFVKQPGEGEIYRWGSFILYLSNPEQIHELRERQKNYKQEYKDIDNVLNYMVKKFRITYGKIRRDKK